MRSSDDGRAGVVGEMAGVEEQRLVVERQPAAQSARAQPEQAVQALREQVLAARPPTTSSDCS